LRLVGRKLMDESSPIESAEQETARRSFLKLAFGILAAVNGLVFGIPFIALFGSTGKRKKADWLRVTEIESLPQNQPVELKFEADAADAFRHSRALYSVWVIKHASDSATVFSPICTHLDCRFIWNSGTGHFECPCHAGVFAVDGKVLSGPARRPLDRFDYRIENGMLFVKWERFMAGAAQKIAV